MRLNCSESKRRARSRPADAGDDVMKMIEAAKMPQPRHEKIPPQPEAASACRRHHKEAVKELAEASIWIFVRVSPCFAER